MKHKVAVSNMVIREKLIHKDPRWPTFNASFTNCIAEAEGLLDTIYKGHAITTHHKNHWRASGNFLAGQHIGLDFDSGGEDSTLKYLSSDKFITKYAAFIHTTISHTEDHPRARVVFLLDTPIYQAKNYTNAVRALLWLFGTADRQCKDAVRFFYGAPNCNVSYLNNVLPLDLVKKLIQNYQETGQTEKKRSVLANYMPTATQVEVADALRKIPPWGIEYDEWLSVLMAIHAQFGDGGYNLAECWADGKPGEVEQKWKSFRQGGNETGQITIATLFAVAKRFGWTRDNIPVL